MITNPNARQIVSALVEKTLAAGYRIAVLDPENYDSIVPATNDAAAIMAGLQTMDKDRLVVLDPNRLDTLNRHKMIAAFFLVYQPEPWDGTDVICDFYFPHNSADMNRIAAEVEAIEQSLGAIPGDVGPDDWSPAEPSPSNYWK